MGCFIPNLLHKLTELTIFLTNYLTELTVTIGVVPTYCYVDSLLDLEFPVGCFDDGSRSKLNDDEMIGLCVEFLTNGADTTLTTLQWVMANLVKHQHIQQKLSEEIKAVVVVDEIDIKDEHLEKMPYLNSESRGHGRIEKASTWVLHSRTCCDRRCRGGWISHTQRCFHQFLCGGYGNG